MPATVPAPATVTSTGELRLFASPSCADIRYGRLHWRFTRLKAAVVKRLLQAASTPFPEVHHSDLATASGAFSELRKLFRTHPAWGELIISMGSKRRGYYRLATENELKELHIARFGKK